MSRSVAIAYLLILALFAVSSYTIPGYGSWISIKSMLVVAAFLGIASIGQTLTILLGGIDLSIPAVIGLANVLAVRWYGAGLPFPLVVVAILLLGAALGAANALISRALRAHPLLVTLGASFIILGAVLVYTEGQTVGTVPDYLLMAVSPAGSTGPVPLPFIVLLWLTLTLAIPAFERRTVFGRFLFATGANEPAARLSLVPVTGLWVAAFAASGTCAALAGILLAGFSGAADASVGQPYLFQTVAAVVVGGTALLGGSGGYARTFAGAILITQITTLLIGLGFSERFQQIMLGLLIIILVAFYGRESAVRNRI